MIVDTEKKETTGKITVPIILTVKLDALHSHNKIILHKPKCAQLLSMYVHFTRSTLT